jgi:hypothetical protein
MCGFSMGSVNDFVPTKYRLCRNGHLESQQDYRMGIQTVIF